MSSLPGGGRRCHVLAFVLAQQDRLAYDQHVHSGAEEAIKDPLTRQIGQIVLIKCDMLHIAKQHICLPQ